MFRIAIGVPAFNEARHIVSCVGALLAQTRRQAELVVVMVNNSTDETARRLYYAFEGHPRLDVRVVSLPAPFNHVGWARRLAMDAAADCLCAPSDVLMTTDADTVVADDWIEANLRHLQDGCQAVAGAAHLAREERSDLSPEHRHRLFQAGKYLTALAYLRAEAAPSHDPWPRHDYEGGASIALRLADYRAMGGSPTLPCHEDRALFDAVRANGGRVRHAVDVRVLTSCRLAGRASGGTADTLGAWGLLDEHEEVHGLPTLATALDESAPAALLCFADLDRELATAQVLVRRHRRGGSIPLGRPAPEVQAV